MKRKPRRTKRGDRRRRKDDLLDAAIQLHKSGELVRAERAYQRVLDANPDDPQALYLQGVVTGRLGRLGEAIALLQRAVVLEPDHLRAISELARLFQEAGQWEASVGALRKLISLRPDLGELYSNLGVVLGRMGKPAEAADACGKAVELNPDCAEAHSNLGDALRALHRWDAAAAAYQNAIDLDPAMVDGYRRLAAVLNRAAKPDEAAAVLEQWLKYEPENPIARHMMAAYSGDRVPERASDSYVRRVFDEFAARFDDDLRDLDYQGPRLIGEAVLAELTGRAEKLVVLDAGCGTGLCGPLLRPFARRLVGVDLSGMMIQKARERKLYDDLVEDELTEYLNGHPRNFDLIAAADTFNYFGSLEPLMAAASRALRGAGLLIFTLEQCDEAASVTDYRLNLHGRYGHDRGYVRRCLHQSGLTVSSMELANLRKDAGQVVTGIVVRAQKNSSCGRQAPAYG